MLADLRFAVRVLRKNPGFTAGAVLTLALGIGANVAVFTVFHATLVESLPYAQPDRLVHLWATSSWNEFDRMEASYPDYLDWREQATTLAEIAGYAGAGFTVQAGTEPERISATRVTPNFFALLGVLPVLGRDFRAGEEMPGNHVVLLTYGYWQRRFGGDPGIAGRALTMDGLPYTVVGVLPPDFHFALRGASDAWVPLNLTDDERTRRSLHWLDAIGRLEPGIPIEQAAAEMRAISARLGDQYPDSNTGQSARVVPLRNELSGQVRPVLVLLMAAVSLVLLIACVNVAGLMLARGATRATEMAIRTALGAGRPRLIRQVLIESLLLAVLGGGAGMLAASFGVGVLVSAIPESLVRNAMPYLAGVGLDWRMLGFTLVLTMGTGLAFGLVTAIRGTRGAPSEALKEGGRRVGGADRPGLRRALVVVQVALALVLLVGAGLIVQSLQRLLDVPLGFNPERLVTFRVLLPQVEYSRPEQITGFVRSLRDRVEALPGVVAVTTASSFPVTNDGNTALVTVEGVPAAPGREAETAIRTVSPNYFQVMEIPFVEGEPFMERGLPGATPDIIVNEAFVRRYITDGRAIGRRVTFQANGRVRRIVAVVGDVRLGNLDVAIRPTAYFSQAQVPANSVGVLVRTSTEPTGMLNAIRREMQALDAGLPMFLIHTMDELIAQSPSVFQRRYLSLLLASLALSAALLAVVGLYGLISYQISQRTHEIGLRMALGAARLDIYRLVIKQGLLLSLAGVALGLAAAWGVTPSMASLLFGVGPTDARTFTAVATLLVLVALAACWLPARRATRVDPMAALREG